MKSLSVGNVLFGLSIETPIKIFTVERVDKHFAYCDDTIFCKDYDSFVSMKKRTKRLEGITKVVPFADEDEAMKSELYKKYRAYKARSYCNLFDYHSLSDDDIIKVKKFLVELKHKED